MLLHKGAPEDLEWIAITCRRAFRYLEKAGAYDVAKAIWEAARKADQMQAAELDRRERILAWCVLCFASGAFVPSCYFVIWG